MVGSTRYSRFNAPDTPSDGEADSTLSTRYSVAGQRRLVAIPQERPTILLPRTPVVRQSA